MKFVKIAGLAALAAMALMALAGAGTASATVLCKTAGARETCAAGGWDYNMGTNLKASLEKGTGVAFKTLNGEVFNQCETSEYEVETSNTGGETLPVVGHVGKFTLGSCGWVVNVPELGIIEIKWTNGTDHGGVTAKEYKINIAVLNNNCAYVPAAGESFGTLTGGMMATIDVHTTLTRSEGPFVTCPATLVMIGAYTVTSPEPLYVSKK
jgi:hypothetical protein